MSTKKQLINEFEICLYDFWGETPTRREIVQAWKDFLDTVAESELVDKKWYVLSMDEKKSLYRKAGI